MDNHKIDFHDCDHPGQDKLHGKGRRVFNRTKQTSKDSNVYRCTVCGKEKNIGGK